jgi:hypothetical protein
MLECETLTQAASGTTARSGTRQGAERRRRPTSPTAFQDHLEAAAARRRSASMSRWDRVRHRDRTPACADGGRHAAGTNRAIEKRVRDRADGAHSRVKGGAYPDEWKTSCPAIMVSPPLWMWSAPTATVLRHYAPALPVRSSPGWMTVGCTASSEAAREQFGGYDEPRLRRRLELATVCPTAPPSSTSRLSSRRNRRTSADDVLVGDAARPGHRNEHRAGDGATSDELAWVLEAGPRRPARHLRSRTPTVAE